MAPGPGNRDVALHPAPTMTSLGLPIIHDLARRSPATRLLHRDLGHHDERGFCPYAEPDRNESINLELTNVCQAGEHDRCVGPGYVYGGVIPWRCRCLCHHARDREREPGRVS